MTSDAENTGTELQRYIVLMHVDESIWQSAPPEVRERYWEEHNAFDRAVRERGAIVAAESLARAADTTTVRRRGSEVLVTDGPFAETREQLGGFYVVDLPDLATALEAVALLPAAYIVEVRAAADVDDL